MRDAWSIEDKSEITKSINKFEEFEKLCSEDKINALRRENEYLQKENRRLQEKIIELNKKSERLELAVNKQQVNQFTDKEKINHIWQMVLSGASHSVFIFAGDVSWIQRDRDVIKQQTTNGVNISVLCRRPRTNLRLQKNISQLIRMGANVTYYNENNAPIVRGLVVDSDIANNFSSSALTVAKSAKKIITSQMIGVPGTEDIYQYNAMRYVLPDDLEQVKLLSQLFQAIQKTSMIAVVLEPKTLSKGELLSILSNISQYASLQLSDIQPCKRVGIQSLWASCTYVKDHKFANIRALLDAYATQGILPFTPCVCTSHVKSSLLLPPILEKHGDKLVVIDGMHRLFYRLAFTKETDAECIILSTNSELPSKPIPFKSVKALPYKLPRQESFIDFSPELFRDIKLLDSKLVELYS